MSVEDEVHEHEPVVRSAAAPQRRVSSLGAGALAFLGVALAAGGAAGLASEHVSWTLHRYASQVAAYGVSFDVVCAAGLALFAAGLVARGVVRVSRQVALASADQEDRSIVLDQLLAELTDVRAGVDQLLTQPAVDEEEAAMAQAVQGQNEKDALFRMAASLDQLSGRLSKRVATDLGAMKAELTRIATGTDRLAVRLDSLEEAQERAQAAPAPAPVAPAPAFEPAAPAPEPAAPAPEPVAAAPAPEPAPAPAAVRVAPEPPAPAQAEAPAEEEEEEDAVMVDLDAEEGSGLELLERLEEEVEGKKGDGRPELDLYQPPPALPGEAAQEEDAREDSDQPRSYGSSLDRLLPEDRLRDAIDDAR